MLPDVQKHLIRTLHWRAVFGKLSGGPQIFQFNLIKYYNICLNANKNEVYYLLYITPEVNSNLLSLYNWKFKSVTVFWKCCFTPQVPSWKIHAAMVTHSFTWSLTGSAGTNWAREDSPIRWRCHWGPTVLPACLHGQGHRPCIKVGVSIIFFLYSARIILSSG